MKVLLAKDPLYTEVYERYTHCLEDKQARYAALAREMYERDHVTRLEDSYNDGISQGITQGISQGAYSAKLETARNLLHLGLSHEQIAQATDLSIAEIEGLQT